MHYRIMMLFPHKDNMTNDSYKLVDPGHLGLEVPKAWGISGSMSEWRGVQ